MLIGQKTLDHLNKNVVYPATGEQIIRADGTMAGIPPQERQVAMEKIRSRKTYRSSAEVTADLQANDPTSLSLYAGHAGPYVRFSLAPIS